MAQPVVQASFNSGEWAPSLYSRVDIAKYRSGAALLRNFYVDYRGGASTRTGTRYILKAYKDTSEVRLIPFQASFEISYALEFGDEYIRFHKNGAPVLESGLNITNISQGNPCTVTVANAYTTGDIDWVYISGVGGMTELNGKYFIIHTATSGQITLYDLFGNPVDSTSFTPYSGGGTTQRVYTIASPYAAADLSLLKFVQNINSLIICHPDYRPRILTYSAPTSWALSVITFGSTASKPSGVSVTTTLSGGTVYYSYVVTSIDGNGQESAPSNSAFPAGARQDIRVSAGTNSITWTPVTGAVSYNVYRADPRYKIPVPAGVPYGFLGNAKSNAFYDSNIIPDFSQPPPTANNPFAVGSSVSAVIIGVGGSYTTAPTVTFGAPPAPGITATGTPVLGVSTAAVSAGGTGYGIGDTITLINGTILTVATLSGSAVATVTVDDPGSVTTLPSNPVAQSSSSGGGTGASFNLTWTVTSVTMTNNGIGYMSVPSVTFSAGAATGTAVLGAALGGYPSVPAFFQQRLALAASNNFPQTIYFSQPGNYFNYDISTPSQDDDAITGSLINGQLNNIKAMVPQPGGLIVLTDGASFLINGGSLGSAITPSSITSNAQSFLGCNDMPPIVVNFDILYVQSKGNSVRDSSYNFYANVFTGEDVSVISSHLFIGYELWEWCWAEEPYKIVWAVRNDGTLLSFTFLKEQEFSAWAHHDTDGYFRSVATIVEAASVGFQNFVYTVVERTIGATTVQYIEYFPERATTHLAKDFWTVDSGISYSGSPRSSFSGGEHLAGKTVTGLADGYPVTPFVMPADGNFSLPDPVSQLSIGLSFTAQLQTLPIDIGDPTIQSKVKKIPSVNVRVVDTLGLKIGPNFSQLTDMKDLIRGQVSSTLVGQPSQIVTDLVTGDAVTYLAPTYTVPGQYCIEQSLPYPATITGVFPELSVGDTPK